MDFELLTDLETLPATIDYNHEQLKTWLTLSLTHYNGLVVTEDSIREAKADKAKLNALKKAIEDKRKEVKKACLAPYETFEKNVKELVALIDAPILAIDGQVKAFDDVLKAEKKAEIESFYQKNIGDLLELVPLVKMWDERWLNVTFRQKEIETTIIETIDRARKDLESISALKSPFETQIKDKYLNGLDLGAALEEKMRLDEQQKRLDEYEAKKADEILLRSAESMKQEYLPEQPAPEYIQPHDVYMDVKPKCGDTKTIKVIFYETTAEFRADMKALTERHNIKYGGIN
ncbi:MAG: DUF1351 domain-containing protein [Eubacteriales bacterium]|nr:DUF1351 domain-containing protein [Eubacteriales bacterium]